MLEFANIGLHLAKVLRKIANGHDREAPLQRAIRRLQGDFPVFKAEIPESISTFIRLPDAQAALEAIVGGDDSESTAGILVALFVDNATIPGLTPEAARLILRQFVDRLADEAVGVGSPEWHVLQQLRRSETTILQAGHRRHERLEQLITSGPQTASPMRDSSELSETPDHELSEWHRRVDSANRLREQGHTEAAIVQYRQIAREAESEGIVDKQLLYRLNVNIGSSMMDLGRPEEGERFVRRARRLKPDDNLGILLLAHADIAMGCSERAAARLAEVLSADPMNDVAWQLKVSSGVGVNTIDDLPPELRDDPKVLLALAIGQMNKGNGTAAIATTKKACVSIGTDILRLLVAAEMLLYLCTPVPGARMSRDDEMLLHDLLQVAFAELARHDDSPWKARALACRAALCLRTGDAVGAARDARNAYDEAPSAPEAIVAWACALACEEQYEEALIVLDTIAADGMSVTQWALRAHVVAGCEGNDDEIKRSILAALEGADDAVPVTVWIGLADLATRKNLTDVAASVVATIGSRAPTHMIDVFNARVWKHNGDDANALRCYERAFQSAPKEIRAEVGYEYASAAGAMGSRSKVLEIIEEVGLDGAPESVWAAYFETLVALKRWDTIASTVELIDKRFDPAPEWAVGIATDVAVRRDDYNKAVCLLEDLIARAGSKNERAHLYLAWVLSMKGDEDKALAVARELTRRHNLPLDVKTETAKTLSKLGDHDLAIKTAYLAIREAAARADVEAVYVSVFLRAPDSVVARATPEMIGSNTWVRLVDEEGNDASYWVLDAALEATRVNEVTADSSEAKRLLGRQVGDSVTLRPMDVDPQRYEVREIMTVWARAYQEVFEHTSKRISVEESPIQMIRLGDPDSVHFLSHVLPMLRKQQEAQAVPDDLYAQGKLPVSVFAVYNRSPFLDAYIHARHLPCGLLVESGSETSLEAARRAVESAEGVVCHTSAIITLHELGMLYVVGEMFDDIVIPASLPVELRRDIDMIRERVARGKLRRLGLEGDRVVVSEAPASILEGGLREVEAILEWANEAPTVMIRPVDALMEKWEETREFIGWSSFDTFMLTNENTPVYADDLALRGYAQGMRGSTGFSTYTLLERATSRGLVSENTFRDCIGRLIELSYRVVPVDAEYLEHAIRGDQFQLGQRFTGAIDNLCAMDPPWAAREFAAFVRRLAVSPIGRGVLVGVVKYVLEALAGRFPGRRDVIAIYFASASRALWLLPKPLADVEAEFKRYLHL